MSDPSSAANVLSGVQLHPEVREAAHSQPFSSGAPLPCDVLRSPLDAVPAACSAGMYRRRRSPSATSSRSPLSTSCPSSSRSH